MFPPLSPAGWEPWPGGVLGYAGGKLVANIVEPSNLDWLSAGVGVTLGSALLAWGGRQMLSSDFGRALLGKVRHAADCFGR